MKPKRLARGRNLARLARLTLLIAAVVAAPAVAGEDGDHLPADDREALSALPPAPKLNAGKVSIGERLFHDPVLSRRQTLSCSSCHDLSTGGTILAKRTVGYDGRMHAFNAPTIFNVGNNYRLGWRGKFTSLAIQNEAVLLDRNLMSNDWQTLIPRLTQDDYYRGRFEAVYGEAPTRENVLDALVTYQRSLVTPNAAFDRFLEGDSQALSPEQKNGYKLFRNFGCISCHQGSNIGGNMFQIFGVFADPNNGAVPSDEPQWPQLNADRQQETFRVPSLRNVEVTGPYFHDGRAATLREAVAIMGRSQLGRRLTEKDIDALVAFLNSLTGEHNGERLKNTSAKGPR